MEVANEPADGDDAVAVIVRQWRDRLPGLDPSPLLVLGRVERLAAVCDPVLRPPFAGARLAPGDFDVLAALRRSEPTHGLSNAALARATLVTPSAMTKRIDRLAGAGFVTRDQDPGDARGRVLALTGAGRRLVDRLIRAHMANQAAILSALDEDEQRSLGSLLGKLLSAVEGPGG